MLPFNYQINLGINHYGDVIMGEIASQITSPAIVYSTVYSDADQRKHQSPASLAFVRGIHRGPVNSPHKWPVTRKMFPFDDVIMIYQRIKKNNMALTFFNIDLENAVSALRWSQILSSNIDSLSIGGMTKRFWYSNLYDKIYSVKTCKLYCN